MKSLKYVFNQHKDNLQKINILALNEIKVASSGTALGYWWVLVKDIIYFIAYIGFMTLLFSDSQINGMPRIVYLVTGLIPWYFINECLNSGARAIKKRGGILTKMKFPLTIVPTYDVLSILYRRAASYSIVFVILAYYGYLSEVHWLYFIYTIFASFVCMASYAMLVSGFLAVSKDFNELYNSIMRVMFFFIPILWSFEKFTNPGPLQQVALYILKANPLVYLVEASRYAFTGIGQPSMAYNGLFWLIVVVMLTSGCYVQYKLRKIYADFL